MCGPAECKNPLFLYKNRSSRNTPGAVQRAPWEEEWGCKWPGRPGREEEVQAARESENYSVSAVFRTCVLSVKADFGACKRFAALRAFRESGISSVSAFFSTCALAVKAKIRP